MSGFLKSLLVLVVYWGLLPQLSAEDMSEVEIKAIAKMADSIPEQKPGFAADCQYGFAMFEALAKESDFLVDVRGNDEKVAADSRFMKNVWALVLYREAVREKKDPMDVKSRLKREISKRGFVRHQRMRSGPLEKIENHVRKCGSAMTLSGRK